MAAAVREALAPALQESLGSLVAEVQAGPDAPGFPAASDSAGGAGRKQGFLSRAWAWFQARVRQVLEGCIRAAGGTRAALYQLWQHKGQVLAALGLLLVAVAAGGGRWQAVAGLLAEVVSRGRRAWGGLSPARNIW